MRIALVNPPHRFSADIRQWITVPPQGYGAIQWVCAHLIKGLSELGHDVTLLGAPGSVLPAGVRVLDAASPEEFEAWAVDADVEVIHDHSNGLIDPTTVAGRISFLSTHHLTGPPRNPLNCTFVSVAQRAAGEGPVIPLPIDPDRHRFLSQKDDYLLFLGRISPHKGAYEAAAFAAAAGRRLVLAGPSWEFEYLGMIESDFGHVTTRVGEVGGAERRELIAHARAVLVLSQPVVGPWGHLWCEPGATVVSEAAVSGTPTVATVNGCLPAVVEGVGRVVGYGSEFTTRQVNDVLADLPTPKTVRHIAIRRWHYRNIARRYERLYRQVLGGERWGDPQYHDTSDLFTNRGSA